MNISKYSFEDSELLKVLNAVRNHFLFRKPRISCQYPDPSPWIINIDHIDYPIETINHTPNNVVFIYSTYNYEDLPLINYNLCAILQLKYKNNENIYFSCRIDRDGKILHRTIQIVYKKIKTVVYWDTK